MALPVTETLQLATQFLYGAFLPRTLTAPLTLLFLYFILLLLSSAVLYFAVKIVGGGVQFPLSFTTAMFTIFIRDLILVPLILITVFVPFGIFISLAVWVALIKQMFKISWVQAAIAFILTLVLPLIVLLFVIIPIAVFV